MDQTGLTRRCALATVRAALSGQADAQIAGQPARLARIEGFSGAYANAGEAVWRNLLWAVERINRRGGVLLASGKRRFELLRIDSKGSTEGPIVAACRARPGRGTRAVPGTIASMPMPICAWRR